MVDTVPHRRPPIITPFPFLSFTKMPVTILTQEPFIPVLMGLGTLTLSMPIIIRRTYTHMRDTLPLSPPSDCTV